MWRKPVGLGAMRTRTDMSRVARLSACCSAPTASGGIKGALDRAAEIGADAVQMFTQSPRMWRFPVHAEEDLARFRERRAETGIGASSCHALYLCNLATPDDEIYDEEHRRRCAPPWTPPARSRPTASSSTSARISAPGFEAGLERCVPALERVLDAAPATTWLLLENSAGAGGTIGRSLDELAALVDALGGHPRLGVCLDSCHLLRLRRRRRRSGDASPTLLADLDSRIGLDRLRALHVNDARRRSARTATGTRMSLEGELGERLGAFLAHPAVQGLPAVMETPGPDGHGPDAPEVQKLRDLHKRWTKKKRR